jgi:hypothetical protein
MTNYLNQFKQPQSFQNPLELLKLSYSWLEFQQVLVQKQYNLSVELSLRGDCDDYGTRKLAHSILGTIELECWDKAWNPLDPLAEFVFADSGQNPVTIGHISGWRMLSSDPNEVLPWSETINFDLYLAFHWLLAQNINLNVEPAMFIDRVIIKPDWREQPLVLRAIATYLDLVGCKFVFLQPTLLTTEDLLPQQQHITKQRLRLYWQTLGLKYYDPEDKYCLDRSLAMSSMVTT